jgi:O-antigen/teichoic acid export membrane protein
LLLGESFRPAETIARIAGTAAAVKGCSAVLASALRGLGKPLQSSVSDVLATVLLLVLLVVLVPTYGAEGAATAVLLSAAVGLTIVFGYLLAHTSVRPTEIIDIARSDVSRLLSLQARAELASLMEVLRAR